MSSPALANAFAEGVAAEGGTVVDVGEVSTDALYFASGKLDLPGAMFTASHNPARYNGMKMCRAQAVPIGSDSGIERDQGHWLRRSIRPRDDPADRGDRHPGGLRRALSLVRRCRARCGR